MFDVEKEIDNLIKENNFINEQVTDLMIDFSEQNKLLQESVVSDVSDIFYNRVKYENGEINLLFITGYSGGGKSTMSNSEKKILREVVDMDKIILCTNKPDDYFIKMGNFAKAFMIDGPGKKYRSNPDEDITMKNNSDDFRKIISKDMITFCKSYASKNKRKKLIMEGVWIYRYLEPKDIEQYAVYIKGTSLLTSTKRAIKRDLSNSRNKDVSSLGKALYVVGKSFKASKDILLGHLEKFQKYFGEKYKKQLEENEKIDPIKQIGNTSKGMIHDAARYIKKKIKKEMTLHEAKEINKLAYNKYFTESSFKDITNEIVDKIKKLNIKNIDSVSYKPGANTIFVLYADGDNAKISKISISCDDRVNIETLAKMLGTRVSYDINKYQRMLQHTLTKDKREKEDNEVFKKEQESMEYKTADSIVTKIENPIFQYRNDISQGGKKIF